MPNWNKIVEDGRVFYVNEELGNVFQVDEGHFIALMPKVVKMGMFTSLEDAQDALDKHRGTIDLALDEACDKVVNSYDKESKKVLSPEDFEKREDGYEYLKS